MGFSLNYAAGDPMTFEQLNKFLKTGRLFSKLLGLAAIVNLPVFLFFTNKKLDHTAKGILLITLLCVGFVMVNKLL